jgi:WD40 repeat protein
MLVWRGHRAKVRSLAFSPNGRCIATTAGSSKFVWLWEATTGKLVRKLNGGPLAMRSLAFLPDGRHIVGLHERRSATVWDADTGEIVSTLETTGWMYGETLAVSPDGKRLIVFTNNQFAEWDDPARPAREPRLCDRTHVNRLGIHYPFLYGFSPAGTYFWRTAHDLTLFDANFRTERRKLHDPDGAAVAGCAFPPDESRVCVAFGHRGVVWRLDDANAPPVKLRGHKQQVRAVGFLPGGGTILTAAMDGTVRLWDATTGAETRSFDWGIGKVRVAAVSPDGAMCAAGSDDGQLVVWDVDV